MGNVMLLPSRKRVTMKDMENKNKTWNDCLLFEKNEILPFRGSLLRGCFRNVFISEKYISGILKIQKIEFEKIKIVWNVNEIVVADLWLFNRNISFYSFCGKFMNV